MQKYVSILEELKKKIISRVKNQYPENDSSPKILDIIETISKLFIDLDNHKIEKYFIE